jgi:aquaporin Z
MGAALSLRRHWPEYLIEGWALGMFMLSAGAVVTLMESSASPLPSLFHSADLRRVVVGIAMGVTAILLIYSPWGKRSGAHMNPAVTATYWRLGKMSSWDALFYVLAQFVGGTLGVVILAAALPMAFSSPPVDYIVTIPGAHGRATAFVAEYVISTLLMWTILNVSASRRYAKFTGLCAGAMVALYITFEAPLSGMSMNPARTFASALPAHQWTGFWIYLFAPVLGMQSAAAFYIWQRGRQKLACAKLQHPEDQRCIHCGHLPKQLGVRLGVAR